MVSSRWGHKGVYVHSQDSVYYVGGELDKTGSVITNEVLKLDVSPSRFMHIVTLSRATYQKPNPSYSCQRMTHNSNLFSHPIFIRQPFMA